jgi:hypothetical protein
MVVTFEYYNYTGSISVIKILTKFFMNFNIWNFKNLTTGISMKNKFFLYKKFCKNLKYKI